MEKSKIVRDIIESVRQASPQGGFVKKVNGEWFDVGERARREKTGQQIRDLLHHDYKSSTKAKARTRKNQKGPADRLPPRSVSAPKSSSMGSSGFPSTNRTGSSLPKRIVTLDSQARASIQNIGMQYRMRQNSDPDMAKGPGELEPFQGWSLANQQSQQQPLQGSEYQANLNLANFMQQQQQQRQLISNQNEPLQFQRQMYQQQNQLFSQQQMMQQNSFFFNQDQQVPNNSFAASQQSSLLAMQQQHMQQQQFNANKVANSMANLSGLSENNSFMMNAGNTRSSQTFLPNNNMSSMGTFPVNSQHFNSNNNSMMPIVYDNDTSASTMPMEESASSYEDSYSSHAFHNSHNSNNLG